ncbi:MAG TPA: lauroyl acyltransferase [Porphyromonadaceae bacterium]|nr:lauroyl acyltransferase [Porphyromonadaceae bacterium]
MAKDILILLVGLSAQLLFSIRTLVQWIASEKAKKVLSPVLFWQLSLLASFIFCMYGWLRNDFAIVLGQLISYYIYIWNLKIENNWQQLNAGVRFLAYAMPIAALLYVCSDIQASYDKLFNQTDLPLSLILFGSIGQLIFVFRFIYQWWYSSQIQRSVLPFKFWLISLVGASIIFTYGIIRFDIVLMLGQSFGLVVYIRNMILWKNESVEDQLK